MLADGSLQFGSIRSLIETFSGIHLNRGSYVTLGENKSEYFIGEVIEGPYYGDRATAKTEAVSVYVIELSASVKNGVAGAVLTRPLPGTPVKLLQQSEVETFLETGGGMRLGKLPTQDAWVEMDPATLTRHLGIFGTTGAANRTRSKCS